MKRLKLKLKGKKVLADKTMAFQFDLKGADFKFIPGQYIGVYFEILLKKDPLGNIKSFSMTSTPRDNFLEVGMRMRPSGFKETLDSIKIGKKIEIEGPYGQFTLPDSAKRPIIFIAGGIGIAPFVSIIKHVTENNLPYKIKLFYSDKNLGSMTYLSDLEKFKKKSEGLNYIITLSGKNLKNWQGSTGRINKRLLKNHLVNVKNPLFYISGSPDMVYDIRQLLLSLKYKEKDIRAEEFAGY